MQAQARIAETAGTQKVLQMLRVLPSTGGIGLITAPAVSGKSWAIERAMLDLPNVRRIDPTPAPSGASPRAFFREVAVRLGIPVRGCDGAPDIEMQIERHIVHGGLLLVIDQAEEMPRSWLPCLRHLADALGSLALVGRETFRDRIEGHAGLAGRTRFPIELPAPSLMEAARHFGEEFDQDWIQATYEAVSGSWGALASMAETERMRSLGMGRPVREATADDARAVVQKFLVRAA